MLSGLSTYLPESALTLFDNLEFFVRLLLSAGLGALVGLERSKRQKEAGVRTHCIIACTSALFMILSKYAFVDIVDITGTRGADPARIAAQVVSGISFLGAGVIFKNGNSIRGLTTARSGIPSGRLTIRSGTTTDRATGGTASVTLQPPMKRRQQYRTKMGRIRHMTVWKTIREKTANCSQTNTPTLLKRIREQKKPWTH